MLYCREMLLSHILSFLLLLLPGRTFAQDHNFIIVPGVHIPFLQVMGNIYKFMAVSALGVCTLLFLLGAGQITISHGDQTKVDNGKKMMISALVGLAIILGSYGIMRTILYFTYEWAP